MASRRPRPKVIELTKKHKGLHAIDALVASEYLYLSQADGDLVKLSRRTYDEVWRHPSDGFTPTVALDGGVLLAGGHENRCARLDVNGRRAWKIETYYDPFRDGNHLMSWGWTREFPGMLAKINPSDGAVVRQWKLLKELTWSVCLPGLRAVGTRGDLVVCYDLEREEIAWRRQYGPALVGKAREERAGDVLSLPGASTAISAVVVGASPIHILPFDEETVLLQAVALFRCSIADGSVLWRFPLKTIPAKPYRSGGRILMLQRTTLVGLDEVTGKEIFRKQYDLERDLQLSLRESPGVWYRNRLAIPFEDGGLAMIDTDDGRIVSMHRERLSLWRAMEIDGDLLLCTGGGKALIYGPEIWQF